MFDALWTIGFAAPKKTGPTGRSLTLSAGSIILDDRKSRMSSEIQHAFLSKQSGPAGFGMRLPAGP